MSTMATSPEKTTSSITVRTLVWYELTLTETGYTIKNCQTQCQAKQASSFGSYTPQMIYEYWGLSATDDGGNTVWLVSSGQTSISMGVVSTSSWSSSTPHSGSGTLTGTRGHSAKTVSLVTNHCGFKDDGASNHYSGTPVTVTIPAKASYAVSFNANGGSGAPSAQTKWYGENLTLSSATPTRTGYTFSKWNTKSDGTGTDYSAGATYTANAAVTLYAVWNPVVTYNANGGSGAPSPSVKTPGTPLTLSTTTPTMTGYTFSKWNTSADGSGTDYDPGDTYSTDAPMTLYAQWTPNTYALSFDANDGKHAPSSVTRTYGQALTLPSTAPVRMAYEFVGWAKNSGGTGTIYQPSGSYTSTAASAETLYAVWRSTYTDPSFAISVVRTDGEGDESDDGEYAKIDVTWAINPLVEPDTDLPTNEAEFECYMSYVDDQQQTVTFEVTLHDAEITGATGATGETGGSDQGTKVSGVMTALVSDIDTDTRYVVTVTVTDSLETSVTKSEVLGTAFFTMDFLAGGHGVAIGKPATTPSLLDIGMDTNFDGDISVFSQPVPPTFYYSTKPAMANLPVTPCIVIQTSDWSIWYADGTDYHQLSGNIVSEVRLTNVDFYTWVTTASNVHTTGIADQLTQARFFASDYASCNLPCVDSHISVYSIDTSGVVYLRCVALDIRTNNVYVNCRNNGTWTGWVQLSPNGHSHSYLPLSGGYLTGQLGMYGNRIYWNEQGWGDQFAIWPQFSGGDDSNYLAIQGAVGGAGTSPSLYNLVTISGKSGNVWIKGALSFRAVLYNNTSGSNGTIGLSASAANYNHMRIYFRINDGTNFVKSVTIHSPNGKSPMLLGTYPNGSTSQYLKGKTVNIIGKSIANNGTGYAESWIYSNSAGTSNSNVVYITRVEAWNE